MPTRSPDDIAELRALLERCCDEIAALSGEAFVRTVEGSVFEPPGDGPVVSLEQMLAGEGGPRWRPLLVGLPPGVGELVSILKPPVTAITALLQVLKSFLEILRALLIGIPDPFEALILAAIAALEAIINDLLNAGAYLYYDAPGLTSPRVALAELGLDFAPSKVFHAGEKGEKRSPRAVDGFERWAGRFRNSFDDPGDKQRPVFSDGASIEAVFLVAAAPSLAELAQLVWLLGNILNIKAFKDALDRYNKDAHDPALARVAERSVAPDWHSKKLTDLLPPLRKLAQVPELLRGLLSKVQSITDLLSDLAAAIEDKVNLLLDIAKSIQDILDLLDALQSSGLYVLPVSTSEGVDGLQRAFVQAANRPQGGFVAGACLLAGGPGLKDAAFLWEMFAGGEFARAGADALATLQQAGEDAQDAAETFADSAEAAWNDMARAIESLPDDVVASFGRTRDELLDALHNAPEELYEAVRKKTDEMAKTHGADALTRGQKKARELSRRGSRSLALYAAERSELDKDGKRS